MEPAVVPVRSATFWDSVREAIRGTEQDFTQGKLSRGILLLAVPMILEMLMESLFAIANAFWVARLGANALATVALTESMLALIFAVAMGLSMSTTAMVARRIGEKDREGAAVAAVQAILLGLFVAVATGAAGIAFAPRLLALMGAPSDLVAVGYRYTAVSLGGSLTVLLLFLNNAVFRGAGDPAIAMRVLWVSNLVNMALDPCFIFGLGPFPEMGVTGAAVTDVIGRGLGVVYQLQILLRGEGRVTIRPRHLRLDIQVMIRLVRVSFTGILQFAIAHTSWVVLVRIISAFGVQAVAGYMIGIRIFVFAVLPAWGLSGAAATMVGQNLGAGKPDRAERSVWITGHYNMLFLAVVAVLLVVFPKPLIAFFTDDPAIAAAAVSCLRIICYGNIVYAYGMSLVQAFNGAGDTVTPTIINLFGFWLCEIPLAYALAFPFAMGPTGVFASIPIAEGAITVVSILVFRRGRWKARQI
jgi:putative MATE family efflux protein